MERIEKIKIVGDAKDLDKAVSDAERSLSRLERAKARLAGGKISTSEFSQFSTLSKQQIAEVERISKARQKFAENDARVINQQKLSEVRIFEATEKSKLRLAEQNAKARTQAENNAFKAGEAERRREFSEFQRIEREKTKVAQAEAKKRNSFSLEKVGGGLQSAGSGIRNSGILLSAAVTAPVIGFALEASKAAKESDDALGQVEARLKSMGPISQRTSQQLKMSATELMHLSTFDDDDILRNVTAALLTFGNVAGEQFDRGQKAAVNMSTALGTDLQSATLQIGKALNDPIKGITALSRAGVSFTAQQKDQIKTLVASGKSVEAQKLILTELEREFGGAAEAARKNDPFSIIRNSAQDFPVLIIIGAVVSAIGTIISAIGAAVSAAGGLSVLLPIIAAIGAVIAVLALGAGALYLAWKNNFGGIRDFTAIVVAAIEQGWDNAMKNIEEIIGSVLQEVNKFWQQNGDDIMKAVAAVSAFIQQTWARVVQFWRDNGETIKTISSEAWNIVKTVIIGVLRQIEAIIKLTAAVINGDWGKAWEAVKELGVSAMNALLKVAQSSGKLFLEAIILIFKAIWALGGWITEQSIKLGTNLVEGIINGIKSKASEAIAEGGNIIHGVINVMRSIPIVQSPSKVTTEIGEYIGEGLAVGLENKIDRNKKAAKKLVDETIKQLQDAAKEFQKFASFSPEQINRSNQADQFSQGANDLKEIIKLRSQTGINNDLPLPQNPSGAAAELKYLQDKKKATDDYADSLQVVADRINDNIDGINEERRNYEDLTKKIEDSGAANLLDLKEEYDQLGVTDDLEKQRIKNAYELIRLREQMTEDGFGKAQIKEAEDIQKSANSAYLEWLRLVQIRKQEVDASKLYKDLDGQLDTVRRNGKEMSEYEKTLKKINEDYGDISAAQRQDLLDKAAQIDAQKQYNEQYKQTYDFIRGTFETLTDSGKTFGEKLKSIFGGIFQSFKKNAA